MSLERTLNEPIFLNSNATHKSFNTTDIAYIEVEQMMTEDYYVKLFLQNRLGVNVHNPKIIFTSGATESLVTCLNWIKHYYPNRSIIGTNYDHSCVKVNCENLDLDYEIIDLEELSNENSMKNVSTAVITSVNPETGEILDYELEDINKFEFVLFDISQAIGKLTLDFSQVESDYGIYFSLHKIGGRKNCGVLIVNDRNHKFKPLIAGSQQEGLRGGTYDLESCLELPRYVMEYEKLYDRNRYKELWFKFYEELKEYVVVPTNNHLYNTLLLDFKNVDCILSKIGLLNEHRIYVTAETSCLTKKNRNRIRISYSDVETVEKNFDLIIKLLKA